MKTDDAFNVNGNFNVTSAGAISAATGITSSGTITFSTFNSNGGVLYTNGSGVLAQATAGTSSQCLLGGTTPTFGSCGAGLATNWWTTSSDGKALAPINSTMDFLLGGTSTASARFAVLGLAGSTPQTSVSGRLIVMPSNGYGNVGINTTNPVVPFDSNGRARIAGSSGSVGDSGFGNYALSVQNNASTSWLEILNNGGAGKGAFFGMSGNDFEQYNYQGGDIIFYANTTPSTSTERLRIAANGNVGIGTDSTPNALFNVGNNSEFQVNSSGAIAAATGIASSGTINFSGLSASSAIYTDGSKNLTSTAPTTGTIGYWSRSAQGALTPATTNDVVAATSSAYNPFTATTNNPAGTLANNTLIQHIAAGTVTNLLTLSRTAGTVTTGLNLTGTIGTDISLQNSATISNASAGTLALTATNIAVNGNLRGATDDTFFSWDYTTNRIGFTKKSGGAGKLTYGSGNSFAIAQSNATGIEATNTFTDRFVLDTSGNVTIGAGNLTMTSGTSFSATALTTLTTSSSVSWGGLTAMTFTADNAVVSGSDVANGNLSLQGTTNATRTTSYVLLQPNGGFVGVGNSAPTVALDVTGDLSASGIMTAGSFVTSNWTIDQNGTCAGSGRLCFDYSGTGQVSFTSGGQGRATNGFVTGTPDYAENITVTDSSIESGDIVTSVIYDSSEENVYRRSIASKSDKEYQGEIIGAISENPGFLAAQANLRDLPDRGWNDNERPLTVAGRIPLKVSSINGKIKVGDRITSSSKPGVGMKATEAGQTVGIAMEPYDNSDPNTVGKILVFIKVGFYDPDVYLTNTGDLNLEVDPATSLGLVKRDNKAIKRNGAYNEGVFGKLRAGIIEVTTITTDSLNIKTDEVRIGDKTLAQYIDSRAQNNGSTPAETEAKITSLQSQIDQLNSVLGVSTTSAEINQITSQINQTQDEIDSLNSENIASQGENGDFEKLHVSGNTLIEGMLTVIDPLKAGELVVTGTANFFDDVVFKGKVRFDNNVQFASNAAGAASISQGTKKVKVTFTKKFDNEPLINTTLTVDGTDTEKQAILNSGYVVAVTDKSETGFTIILNKAAEQDLKFNWSAVQVGN